jgi:hypothetical protein
MQDWGDFEYILIPQDDSAPMQQLTAKAASYGDTLAELLKRNFAGGQLTNMKELQAEYGRLVEEKMNSFQAVANKGTVEVLPLVKPSRTTLPHPMTGTYLYYDEMGALKERPPNRRAFELAKRCGLDLMHQLPGDVYLGRVAIEPDLHSISIQLHELNSGTPWLAQAPSENHQYSEALKGLNSELKEKRPEMVGADVPKEEDDQPWRWTQAEDEVEVTVTIPSGTSAKELLVTARPSKLTVALKKTPAELIVSLDLFGAVRSDDVTWTVGKDANGTYVQVTLEKVATAEWPRLQRRS